MISIDRIQIVTFVLAMAALSGLVLCVAFRFDGKALALGFAFGWIIGIFQTVNHMIIDASEKAIRRRTAPEPPESTLEPKDG